ncbi:hypothetical protein CLOHYLEM_05177 [[Clostridium] hylemonae DSM 15053]|uniref:Uncharacterized protein n=1 Tax=[Clostridium] hylemonae DSM 15053 TaxID=553973 RepID=C0BZD7_9FIRM|nr:hypothetical protein CLOHYLEM_05177 [[Clostridium] hylemonae DSM 15053]
MFGLKAIGGLGIGGQIDDAKIHNAILPADRPAIPPKQDL